MTFSQDVKNELLSLENNLDNYLIKLTAILVANGEIIKKNNNIVLLVKSTQLKIIKILINILHEFFPTCYHESTTKSQKLFNKHLQTYSIIIYTDIEKLLKRSFAKYDSIENKWEISKLRFDKLTEEEKICFLRIFFASCGSVNTPQKEKQYHLEIKLKFLKNYVFLQDFINRYNIRMKVTSRNNVKSLYLNKSEEIGDFLNLLGCREMLFKFEDERILRDLYLTSNRINNADIANTIKSTKACNQQLEMIKILEENNIINTLSKKTQEVIKLRKQFPEASMQDLANLSNGTFSKSNITYHLRLLKEAINNL